MKVLVTDEDTQLRNRMLPIIKFHCGDEGLENMIHTHLQEMYDYRTNGDPLHRSVAIVFNTGNVNEASGAAAQLSRGYMSLTQGDPKIELPPNFCELYIDDDFGDDGLPITGADVNMTLYNAVIFLHELNHMVHHYLDKGKYKNPISAGLYNYDSALRKQIEYNSQHGVFTPKLTKADELETYWRCILDSQKATPVFKDETIEMIKSANNINMAHYERDTMFPTDWLGKDEDYIKKSQSTGASDWYNLDRLHPEKDYEPGDDERPEGKFASKRDVIKYAMEHPEWKYGHNIVRR